MRTLSQIQRALMCNYAKAEQVQREEMLAENERMRDAIKGALRIKDLWLPYLECDEDEGRALGTMERRFNECIAEDAPQ